MPTLVDIAGGPKGDDLKKQIEAGKYPGIVKTTLDGVDQRAYLEGTSDKSARDVFFYYSGSTPSAVRYKNWKMYYTMARTRSRPAGFMPQVTYPLDAGPEHQARSLRAGRRRRHQKSAMGIGGALGRPGTAYLYDWNMLPIGQLLWEKELETYQGVPADAGAGDLQPRSRSRRGWGRGVGTRASNST